MYLSKSFKMEKKTEAQKKKRKNAKETNVAGVTVQSKTEWLESLREKAQVLPWLLAWSPVTSTAVILCQICIKG